MGRAERGLARHSPNGRLADQVKPYGWQLYGPMHGWLLLEHTHGIVSDDVPKGGAQLSIVRNELDSTEELRAEVRRVSSSMA